MTGPIIGRVGRTVLVALIAGAASGLVSAGGPPTVELRLGARGGLDAGTLRLAEGTVGRLLSSAGISADWSECGTSESCAPNHHLVVLVQLLSVSKMTDDEVCGEFVRDQRSGVPTVLVYLPRVVALLRSIRVGSGARSNPALAAIGVGDLVGLTIAHEVGHALGLRHVPSGVMKAQPSLDDVIALRTSTLAFGHREEAIMRLALARSEEMLAQAR